MKVIELVEKMKTYNFDLSSAIEVTTYLPIETKKTIAQGILFDCTEENDGVVKIDSLERYMSYVKYMIKMHTNIEYDEENDYDILCATVCGETNLLNAIMDLFADDARECSRILDLMTDDLMRENSIEFNVAKFLNNIGSIISEFSEKVNGFDLSSVLPDNLDVSKLNEFVSKYGK